MIEYFYDRPDVATYMKLRETVGFFSLTKEQAKRSLANALEVIVAKDKDELVGMARLIGDGAVICYIQDVMVDPRYRGKRIGYELVNRLTKKVEEIALPGTRILLGLMSTKGTEEFYEKCGFIRRPSGNWGSGLTKVIKKDEGGNLL